MKAHQWSAGEDYALIHAYRHDEPIDSIIERLAIRRSALYRRLAVLNEPPREPRKGVNRRQNVLVMPYKEAHRLIREVLLEAKDQYMTMPELAKLSHLCPESIHIWNRGQGDPKLSSLERVGAIVGKRLMWTDIEEGENHARNTAQNHRGHAPRDLHCRQSEDARAEDGRPTQTAARRAPRAQGEDRPQ